MASITSLDGLFELAAADWNFNPPSPVVGAPQVASRTITVSALVEDANPGGPGDPLAGVNFGGQFPLHYSPQKTVLVHPGILRLPASFSGASAGLSVSISELEFGTPGHGVVIENKSPTITISFTLPPPGGTAASGIDPSGLVGISLVGTDTSNAHIAAKVTLDNYLFLLTLKKA
jgi:hypothetical protein